MKKIIILKWDSILLGVTSIVYGITLFVNGNILITYQLYRLIDKIFNHYDIGLIFVALGLLKIIGIWKDIELLKRVALTGLTALWAIFSVSFMLTPPANTVWIFSLSLALLAFGIALKGD